MPQTNWNKKKAPSGDFDTSTGGNRLFASKTSQSDDWQNWGFDFQLVSEPVGYVLHGFPVVDPTNVPIPDYRDDKPTWFNIPCLGSTGEENEEGEMAIDPEGVAECQSIIIPGTDVSVHDCERLENGRTQTMYRAAIFNWDSDCFQILELKSYAWSSLFDSMNNTMERRVKQEKDFDFHNYTCFATAQELPGQFPYKYKLDMVAADHYSWEQVVEKAQEPEHRERYEQVRNLADPVMTPDEVRKAIGIPVNGSDPDKGHGADSVLGDLDVETQEVNDIFGDEDDEEENGSVL